jgi:hypothetical protein
MKGGGRLHGPGAASLSLESSLMKATLIEELARMFMRALIL